MSADMAARAALLLRRLEQAREPLGKAALFGRSPSKADEQWLKEQLASGTVVNLLGRGRFALVTAADAHGRFSPLETAKAALLDHLGSTLRTLPLSETALAAVKVAAFGRKRLRDAVGELTGAGRLVPLRAGRSNLIIAAAGVQRFVEEKSGASQEPVDSLRAAYEALLLPGRSMVGIGEMQRKLGWRAGVLPQRLRELFAAGELHLFVGEPTLMAQQDVDAGVEVAGVTYYLVAFGESGRNLR
jgi:hypothetical protein